MKKSLLIIAVFISFFCTAQKNFTIKIPTVTRLSWDSIIGKPTILSTEVDPVYSSSSWFGTTNNATNWNSAYTLALAAVPGTRTVNSKPLSSNVTLNLQEVSNVGYTTSTPLYSTNKIISGDSTVNRWLIGYGSSLTYQLGNSYIVSDTSTWIHKAARALGFIPINLGIPGETTQQFSVGDNSLYTNATNFLKYSDVPAGSIVVIEGMVNDLKGDTTRYTTTLYESHLGAILDSLIAKGWPLSNIKLFNPSYYFRASTGNIGNTPYRHSIYNTSTQNVATVKNIGFLDNWDAWYAAYTVDNTMLYSDSIHMTSSGSTVAANALTNYLSSNGVATKNYNAVRSVNYGGTTTFGTDSVYGKIVGKEAYLTDINVVGNSRLASLVVGSDLSNYKTGTPNISKFDRIGGLAYANNMGDYSNLTMIAGYSTSTQNIINYGGFTSPSIYLPYYSATNHRWFVGNANSTAVPTQAVEIYPSGNVQVGGTSFSDQGAKLNIAGTIIGTTTTNRGIYQNTALTPNQNNVTQYGYDFANTFNNGTGILTQTLTAGGAGYADGVYTSVALTNITGTGSGAIATITVASGTVTVVTVTTNGIGFALNNTLSAASSFDGVGSGSGLVITVTFLGYPLTTNVSAIFRNAPIVLNAISTPTNFLNGMVWQTNPNLFTRLNGATVQLNIGNTSGIVNVAAGGTALTSYTAGDIIGASGTTTISKIAKGTANQLFGMNSAATSQEYKTISGSGIAITNAANSMTLTAQFAATTATDANTTISAVNTFFILPTPTASRTLTLPAATTAGQPLLIWNKNTSGTFNWSFASTVFDAASTTITTLTNVTFYRLVSDGTRWVRTN